ncbi:MAG: ABC transporter ATP-binding protein/permease [Alphaproteobacteria bacterium]|nr:ABC transporter ATP-binding protein/permease [Alphaproteobacteria bacterium]
MRESVERPSRGNEWRALATLLPYLWPRGSLELRGRVVVAMLLLVGAKLTNVYIPILYKQAVDILTGTAGAIVALPVGLLVAYGLARMFAVAFGELRDAVFAKVVQRAMRTAALRTFEHLHALSLRYHLDRQTGGLSRVIERGVSGIEFLLNFMIFNIVPTILEILLVCGILWGLFDIWFALVTAVTIFGYIAFSLIVTEWRIKFRREMNERDTEANTKAIDSLLNYETVKYFGNEPHEARRYDVALQAYERAAIRSKVSLAMLNVGQAGIIGAGLVAIMTMAGAGVVNGSMTIGDFVLVNAYLIQLYMPLNFLGFVYRQIRQSLTDMDAMFWLLKVEREVADDPGAPALQVNGGEIVFEGVDFGYDPRRPILRDVGFTVPPGRTVAIVGPSGAGKSTISRILFRFYDVAGGSVRIDGQDIRHVSQSSLRAAIGIVPQDTVLFNDTIYYNIRYGRPDASPAEIEEAARLARIHDFVMALPDGYQTRVGERGLKLSGGEKQRVAIARTILKQPSILLFDEATSALDTHTEQEIQKSLEEVSANRTTLVIAHRLSTVVGADEILVLVEGRIVERGRHADLLARDGAYAAMWRRQQEGRNGGDEAGEPIAEPAPVAG